MLTAVTGKRIYVTSEFKINFTSGKHLRSMTVLFERCLDGNGEVSLCLATVEKPFYGWVQVLNEC